MSNLIDSAAVTVLSERLAKIAKLRLTAADLEFLTSNSSDGDPNTRIILPLPKAVTKAKIFLEYFKQHVRQYLLPYMGLAEKEKDASVVTAAATAAQQRRNKRMGRGGGGSDDGADGAGNMNSTSTSTSTSTSNSTSNSNSNSKDTTPTKTPYTAINANIVDNGGGGSGGGGDGNTSSSSPSTSSSKQPLLQEQQQQQQHGLLRSSEPSSSSLLGSLRGGLTDFSKSAPVVLQNIDFDFIYSHGAAVKGIRQQRLKARR